MFLEDVIFPTDISQGSEYGPAYEVDTVSLASGFEKRNSRWEYPLHAGNVGYGVRDIRKIEALNDIFHVAEGQTHAFRYRDRSDYKSCGVLEQPAWDDQLIGIGNGTQTVFQITKTYAVASRQKVRLIRKPRSGTVKTGVGGVELTSGFTVDYTTGEITYTTPPADQAEVRAGYVFDNPVRFATRQLPKQMETYYAGAADVPIVEIRI